MREGGTSYKHRLPNGGLIRGGGGRGVNIVFAVCTRIGADTVQISLGWKVLKMLTYTKILDSDWTVFVKDNKDNRRQKYPL